MSSYLHHIWFQVSTKLISEKISNESYRLNETFYRFLNQLIRHLTFEIRPHLEFVSSVWNTLIIIKPQRGSTPQIDPKNIESTLATGYLNVYTGFNKIK